MRKAICLIIVLFCAWLIACGAALAESEWPESSHPYESNLAESWDYEHPTPAYGLRLVFSDDTQTEAKYDFITITDSNGNSVDYDGINLSGETLILPGSTFTISLSTDGSVNKYGFSFTEIAGLTQAEYETAVNGIVHDVTAPPESDHPYEDAATHTWNYRHPSAADWLRVEFSEDTCLSDSDKITTIDSAGKATVYTGSELSGKVVCLKGNAFTIRLTANRSGNDYGFSITGIAVLTEEEYEAEYSTEHTVSTPPQSRHPYPSDWHEVWHYTHPTEADALRAVFSADTFTEECCDYITIIDSNGRSTEYSGNELSGRVLVLPGDSFTIELLSDSDVNEYGFSITEITALTQAQYEDAVNTVSGACGEHVIWSMDRRTKTLTLSGTGPMENYAKLEDDGYWSLWSPPYWDWDSDLSTDESRRQIEHIVMAEGITTIGAGAFRDLDGLESIVIASTVTSIGGWAFDRTSAIQQITLPDGLTMIDDSSFSDCSALTTINIPSGVTSIGPYAFYYTNISQITLPPNLTRIDEFAFNGTPLTSIAIPSKVETIGGRAFYECTSLQNITVDSNNPYLKSVDGVLFTKDGTEMICYCPGRTDEFYQVPNGVRVIRASAFSYTESLTGIKLPDSLLTIRDWAFGHTGLTEVLLPKNLQEIEFCAFGACSDLTSASLPAALLVIGRNVFDGCPLETVYYEGSQEEWGQIDVAENATLLGAQFYYNENLYCPHTSMTYHPAVAHTCTADGSTAYWECDLCGNKFLDREATRRAGDTVVPAAHSYESAVTTEPTCSETGVRTFTCTVCSEGTEGHSYTVTLPATGAHLYVGGQCVNLLRDGITMCGRLQPEVLASGNCGYTTTSIITLYLYPGQSLNYDRMYSDNVQWTLDSDGTLRISGRGAMCRCIQVTRANNYGQALSSFYASPWYDYRGQITHVIIDHGVTGIGQACFYNCSNMASIELPNTLTSIASLAFQNTSSLNEIYYHGAEYEWDAISNSGLSTTGRIVYFLGATEMLADLVLPQSLTTIDSEAFAGVATKLIQVPGTVTQIADDAFEDDVTLIVESDSYAEEWARTHRIRYIPK